MEDKLYTVSQASKEFGIPKWRIYELINAGLISGIKIGGMKVRRSSMFKFFEDYENKDVTDPYNVKDIKKESNYKCVQLLKKTFFKI